MATVRAAPGSIDEYIVGFAPEVQALLEAVEPYAGPKGNLQFPLDRPIPYSLIERITRHRVAQNLARAQAKHPRAPQGTSTRSAR